MSNVSEWEQEIYVTGIHGRQRRHNLCHNGATQRDIFYYDSFLKRFVYISCNAYVCDGFEDEDQMEIRINVVWKVVLFVCEFLGAFSEKSPMKFWFKNKSSPIRKLNQNLKFEDAKTFSFI